VLFVVTVAKGLVVLLVFEVSVFAVVFGGILKGFAMFLFWWAGWGLKREANGSVPEVPFPGLTVGVPKRDGVGSKRDDVGGPNIFVLDVLLFWVEVGLEIGLNIFVDVAVVVGKNRELLLEGVFISLMGGNPGLLLNVEGFWVNGLNSVPVTGPGLNMLIFAFVEGVFIGLSK